MKLGRKRDNKYIYMEVTKDKYEFPVVIADSLTELAELTGKNPSVILRVVTLWERGLRKKPKYVRVLREEEENE